MKTTKETSMSATSPALSKLLARDVMHAPILGCAPAAPLSGVAALMSEHQVHCVVVDGVTADAGGEHLVWGVISDLDIVRAALAGDPAATAADVATTEAVAVEVDDGLTDVCAALVEHGISHVVVAERGRPAGVISALDVAGVVAGKGHGILA
jgi:CBS domain-containing protein